MRIYINLSKILLIKIQRLTLLIISHNFLIQSSSFSITLNMALQAKLTIFGKQLFKEKIRLILTKV